MNLLVDALMTFLPAGIANMTPILAAKTPLLKQWNTPMDCGARLHGVRIFGDHKTWRGFIVGTILGTAWGLIWFYAIRHNPLAQALSLGFLISAGALLGDAIKSFFKRRVGVDSGKSWFPFDQADYIFGGLLCSAPVLRPSLALTLSIIGIYFGLHILVSYLGYLLGLKRDPI